VTAVRRLHRVTIAAAFAYLVILLMIAFWPVRVDQNAGRLLYRLFAWLYRHDAPRWLDYDFLEFTANVVLFIPVGLFVVILAGARWWWLGIVTGIAASCAIELGQLLFLPSRFATLSDVLANSSGATIGTVLAAGALAIAHRHERRTRARTPASLERRVGVSPRP
jgi:glycopeptide antibiotics resistance protein